LPGKRVVAIQVCDAILDARYQEGDLGAVLRRSHDLTADLDVFTGREGVQGDLLHQLRISLAESIIREQLCGNDVTDAVCFQFPLQFRE